MSGPNRASCDGQLNCGGLHKQTRGNTLSGDVCTPVENHDLVPSFSHHIESQAHSRMSDDPKNQTMQLSDHTNSPRLARDALVLGPSAALNRDPTAAPGVDNTPQAVPQLRVPQQPQHLNLHSWWLGVDNSKNKASLWKWQRELLHLSCHQQGPSTNQVALLKNGAEKIR